MGTFSQASRSTAKLGPNEILLSNNTCLTVNFGKPLKDEDSHQAAIFEWAQKEQRLRYPQLKWLFAIPNGGARDKITASVLKKTGVKAGVLDMCLPVPVGSYAGLWIEQKYGSNRPSELQKEFYAFVVDNHQFAHVSYDWKESIGVIVAYLNNTLGKPLELK